ncbi:BACON domain-containing protein [Streptomyces albus]|uniref:BACON domain-containing protein n=1 Tax=Streptomyces albus TaxID=1888 RepID=UPI00068EA9E6|nr:BACON domain-containing protein [Streptomyces albus]
MNRPEHPTHATGARYEPYLDGLFTYCLAAMCEHDAATAVLGEVLAHAERRHRRSPAEPERQRSRLYALARWTCLRHLAARPRPPAPHRSARPPAPHGPPAQGPSGGPSGSGLSEETAARRRRELSTLVWPEAAGTTREQREALELAVRHRLTPPEVAAVLGTDEEKARGLLTAGAREVERTRAALAVAEGGGCPAVNRLTGDARALMGSDLRRELLRHIKDCDSCRRTVRRSPADGSGPGGSGTAAGALPLVPAPRAEAAAAMRAALRVRPRDVPSGPPRYDRRGFPMGPGRLAARRRTVRRRVATAAVVTAAVTAPVVALWAAYRGAPPGQDRYAGPVSAAEDDRPGAHPYDPADGSDGAPLGRDGHRPPGGPAERGGDRGGEDGAPREDGGTERDGNGGDERSGARLTVVSRSGGDGTLITLTASGSEPVGWTARTDASWLRLSATAGTVRPGRSVSLTVTVDRARQPGGAWTGRVTIGPSGTVVTVRGRGEPSRPGGPEEPPPAAPPDPDPEPAPSPPAQEPTGEPPEDGDAGGAGGAEDGGDTAG